jgi:phage tail-like protein
MPPRTRPQTNERYPYPAYNFIVSVTNVDDGKTVSGAFTEVSGLQVEVKAIEYRDGMDDTTVRKVRGMRTHGNLTFKRGITGHHGFWDWIKRGMDGDCDRQQGHVALLDEDRAEVMRWNFERAWPVKYTGPTLNAKTSEIALETLEIAVENLVIDI